MSFPPRLPYAALLSLFLILPIVLTACGGGGGGGLDGGGKAVSRERRHAVLQEVNARFAAMPHMDPAAENRELAAFMATKPEFEATGVSDDQCAWGRFTDGRLFIVMNNRPVGKRNAAFSPSASRGGRGIGTGLPEQRSLRLVYTMGPAFRDPTLDVKTPLAAHGYELVGGRVQAGTIEELKGVKDSGIFYMDAHGGSGEARSKAKIFGIWTGTMATPAIEAVYDDDLRSNKLVFATALVDIKPDQTRIVETRLAITSKFVAEHMRFGRNSLVFFNACSSDEAGFKTACLAAGAGTYAGWTTPVWDESGYAAAVFLFDRLLGTTPSLPGAPSKPLDVTELRAAMAASGADTSLSHDGSPESKLVFTSGTGDMGVIVPSIRGTVHDAEKNEMTLVGVFGDKPGTVDVDGTLLSVGTPLEIESWSATQIVVKSTVPDAVNVIVRVDGRPGNSFPVRTVQLDPQGVTVAAGGSTTFTATVSGGGKIAYEWITSGDHGILQDSKGNSGKSFTSTDNSITYKSHSGTAAGKEDAVIVKATLIEGNERKLLGSASTTVASDGPTEVPLEATMSFVYRGNSGYIDVWISVPKIEGEYHYKAIVDVPEFKTVRDQNNRVIAVQFGPGTKNMWKAWRGGSKPAGAPAIVGGAYVYNPTSVFTFDTERKELLMAKVTAAWGSRPITATATPVSPGHL